MFKKNHSKKLLKPKISTKYDEFQDFNKDNKNCEKLSLKSPHTKKTHKSDIPAQNEKLVKNESCKKKHYSEENNRTNENSSFSDSESEFINENNKKGSLEQNSINCLEKVSIDEKSKLSSLILKSTQETLENTPNLERSAKKIKLKRKNPHCNTKYKKKIKINEEGIF